MQVRIDNVRETRRALQKYAPEVKKALDKANRDAASPLVAMAKSNVPPLPLSGWRRGRVAYNQDDIKRGIKIKQGRRSKRSPYSAVTQLRNETAAGSIFELAGTKNPNSSFAQNLARRYPLGSVSRVIWKAVKEYPVSRYQQQVFDNYIDAEKKLQQVLDGMGRL